MTPLDLGLPYDEFRPQQLEALERIIGSDKRFSVTALPTGVGKSLLAVATAKWLGARTVILTSTKGLQDQYERDFEQAGVADMRGMSNYPCRELDNRSRCDAGPCLDGEPCIWKRSGCVYFDREKWARESDIVVTNYAYWQAHREDGALGPRDLLICDEAHALVEETASAAGAEFRSTEVRLPKEMREWELGQWREWAREQYEVFLPYMRAGHLTPAEKRKLRNLLERFQRVATLDEENWGRDFAPGRLVRFEPIIPGEWSEQLMFRGIPKIVLMSATIRPQDLVDLGLTVDDYDYYETSSPFEAKRRPIYLVESVRMNAKVSEQNKIFWANKIDQIIRDRLGEKGIIHTVSYDRARELKHLSEYGPYMLIHDPSDTRETIVRFKNGPAPQILVSPSVHTGWDFPFDQARWQIIAKVPFPDMRYGLAHARMERDDTYGNRFAAKVLVQMAGRVVRDEKDMGETFIVDDTMKWLYSYNRRYFPRWFREAFTPVSVAPPPPLDFA